MITFDPKKHKYTDETGREYISVTTLLGKLFPFNRYAIASKISKCPSSSYYKWPIKKIFADWTNSANQGNKLHNACEKYTKTKKLPEDPVLNACIKQYAKLNFKGKITPEQKVYSSKYFIAGTADILEEYDDYFWLWDIKTCKKLDDDRLYKFSLQIEIYKRLIESVYQKPCKCGGIIFFENFVKLQDKTKLTIHKPCDVKDHVDEILQNRIKELNESRV